MENLNVEVIFDKEVKMLMICDCGIGMMVEEIDKYINQIVFLGVEEFVQQYKGKEGVESIIGYFGLGFYLVFMVVDKVQICMKVRYEGVEVVEWESNGNIEYIICLVEKEECGIDIVFYIMEDFVEFFEKSCIQDILNKYCKFLFVLVIFGMCIEYIDLLFGEKDENGYVKCEVIQVENQVNNMLLVWMKVLVDLKDEDYKVFYYELYLMLFEELLFYIYLNVDYLFNLIGILYFLKIKENVEVQWNKINFYLNQVFIIDSVVEIVLEFLMFLYGVIDLLDILLNVLCLYFQVDGNVKKILMYIIKKVVDKLVDMFKKDCVDFELKWDDLKIFVEYGMLFDEKFVEKVKLFVLIKNIDGKYYIIEELKEVILLF